MKPGGSGSAGLYTGVERKTNQSELNVPTWNAKKKCETRVKDTLRVNIRLNGNRLVYRRRVLACLNVASAELRGVLQESSQSVVTVLMLMSRE